MDVHVVIAHLNALRGKAFADIFVQVEIHIPIVRTFAPDPHDIVDDAVLIGAQTDKGRGSGKSNFSNQSTARSLLKSSIKPV